MHEIKEMKVSSTGSPSQLATAVLMALNQGNNVKLTAIGEAIKNIAKAVAFVNKFNSNNLNLRFTPNCEYITASNTKESVSAITFLIENLSDTNIKEVKEDSDRVIVPILNSLTLIKDSINEYAQKGYKVVSMCPIVKDGRTSCVYVLFER